MASQMQAVRSRGTPVALLLCLLALSTAGGDGADSKSKWWRDGSAADLKSMEAKDIKSIQIFRLEWPQRIIDPRRKEEFARKQRATRPLSHDEDTQEMEGLLTLVRQAGTYKKPGKGLSYEPASPDRVLVVEPVEGEPFEILFSSYLHEPFGGVYSLELKEALYALADRSIPISIIHFDKGEVQRVIHESAIAPHTGAGGSQTTKVEMHLTSEKGLTLYVRARDGKDVLMEDEKPLHYGEAKVFKSWGTGSYIVLLHNP